MADTRHRERTADHICRRRLEALQRKAGDDESWRLTSDELEELAFLEERAAQTTDRDPKTKP